MRSSRIKVALAVVAALTMAGCSKKAPAVDADGAEAAASKAFLDKNAKVEGVKSTASGLQYKIIRSGPAEGVRPHIGDEVKVHYEGALADGTVFDSSYEKGTPLVFTLGEVVPGWNEALQLMRPGDVWYLYVPPRLGYGEMGQGPIPPNAVLVFKVELLGVLPKMSAG